MALDLRQLRYFVAIAESGGFSAAAEVLHVAQSALSRHVRHLEIECGGPLFERAVRGVTLTSAGLLLLERARSLLQQAEATRVDVQAENQEPTGLVRLGSSPSVGTMLFQPLASHFLERYPKVRLQLVETIMPDPLSLLSRADLDLAIVAQRSWHTMIEFEPLFIEQMCLFGPADKMHLSGSEPRDVDVLLDIPLVVPAGAGWLPDLAVVLGEKVTRIQLRIEVVSIICMKQMVAAGLGYGVVPLWTLREEILAGQFSAVPIKDFKLTRALARQRDRPIGRVGLALADSIRSVVAELGDVEGMDIVNRPSEA